MKHSTLKGMGQHWFIGQGFKRLAKVSNNALKCGSYLMYFAGNENSRKRKKLSHLQIDWYVTDWAQIWAWKCVSTVTPSCDSYSRHLEMFAGFESSRIDLQEMSNFESIWICLPSCDSDSRHLEKLTGFECSRLKLSLQIVPDKENQWLQRYVLRGRV